MADGDLHLISAADDVIDLNGLDNASASGVQAISGATGFGLPPVEVQYQVGAGDGSRFRRSRVTSRDVDLPLHIKGSDRAELRTLVQRIARALAGECRLQWDDGETVWELKVRRVGGGDFAYGPDTDGHFELRTTITFRAADPFWIDTASSIISAAGQSDLAPANPNWVSEIEAFGMGSAPAYPSITVHGPTLGFQIRTSEDATEGIVFTTLIREGDSITVDMKTGTVVDQDGTNRYSDLAPGPRFFSLDPDNPQLWVGYDNTSVDYDTAVTQPVTNVVVNPTFGGTASWVLGTHATIASGKLAYPNTGTVTTSYPSSSPSPIRGLIYSHIPFAGLVVGRTYDVVFNILAVAADNSGWTSWDLYDGVEVRTPSGTIVAKSGHLVGKAPGEYRFSFTATSESGDIYILPPGGEAKLWSTSVWSYRVYQLELGYVGIVPAGAAYFDGSFADTSSYDYAWTGTAHNSTSTRENVSSDDPAAAGVDVEFSKRNWLVI